MTPSVASSTSPLPLISREVARSATIMVACRRGPGNQADPLLCFIRWLSSLAEYHTGNNADHWSKRRQEKVSGNCKHCLYRKLQARSGQAVLTRAHMRLWNSKEKRVPSAHLQSPQYTVLPPVLCQLHSSSLQLTCMARVGCSLLCCSVHACRYHTAQLYLS
jgi:hypothetical protein